MLDDVSSNIVFELADKLTYRHVKAMCAGACGLMLTCRQCDAPGLLCFYLDFCFTCSTCLSVYMSILFW